MALIAGREGGRCEVASTLPYRPFRPRVGHVLRALVPKAKPGGHPRAHHTRELLDAIFYVVRGGCAWRLLPHDFPPWQTAYHYFRVWRLDGTWEKVHATLRERTRLREGRQEAPSAAIVDSQSVRTTEKGGCEDMTEPRR